MAEQYLSTDPNAGVEDQYLSTDPNAGLEPKPEGGIVSNALAGAGDVIKGFAQQFVPDLSLKHLATIAYGPINAQIQGYNALKSIVDTGEQIAEADKTPPFSRERFAAGFNVAGQLGLLAAGGRAPKLAEIAGIEKPIEAVPKTPEPLVSEVAAKQTETIPEAVPKVEEVIPNAEQVQSPARANVNVQLPGGEAAREVYGGEMPTNVGGEGVQTRGQGETLQQAQEVTPPEAAPVPQPEQPTVISGEYQQGTAFSPLGDAIRRRINTLVDGPLNKATLGHPQKGLPASISGDVGYARDFARSQALKYPDEAARYNKIADYIEKEFNPPKPSPVPSAPEATTASSKPKESVPTEITTAQPLPKSEAGASTGSGPVRDYKRQIERSGIIDLPNGDTIRVLESEAQSGKFDVVAVRDGKRSIISDPANPSDLGDAQKSAVDAASGKTLFTEQAAAPTEQAAPKSTPSAKPSLGEPHEKRTKGGGAFPGSTEMADRAGRVATLLRLNEGLPEGVGYDAEALGRVANGQIDAVRDYLVEKFNEAKRTGTQPVEPPAAPPPVPAEAAAEVPKTGVSSERFIEQYGEDAPVPNTGKSASELKRIGQTRLDNFQKTGDVKDDPYSVLTNLREGKVPVSQLADDVSLIRAEHQRLRADAINAEGTPEYEAKSQAALDMAQAIKEVAHGPASDMMRAFQEYDKPRYDNVTDFDQALRERLGRESTSQERVKFKELADNVKSTRNGAEEAINGAQKRLSKMPKLNFEDAMKSVHDQIAELTKDCVL